MILADTSVWSRHWWNGDQALEAALDGEWVLIHPYVFGELSLGPWRDRLGKLAGLDALPLATLASTEEVSALINRVPLYGRGIGWTDAHLLASVQLMRETVLWTLDKRLHAAAVQLGIAHGHGTR